MKLQNDDELELVNLDEKEPSPVKKQKNEDKEREKSRKRRSRRKEFLLNSLYLLIVFLLTLFVVKFVGQRTVVIGHSMEPTLIDQDNLIVNKFIYRFKDPQRFDVIVFPYRYEKKTYYIKRIIGLPGETVRIDTLGNIYINEELLEENYGAEVITDPGIALSGIKLGADEYFVLGDNRNKSSDSRSPSVGLINRSEIIGKAAIRIYPFNKIGKVK